jgi:hypothetical protein
MVRQPGSSDGREKKTPARWARCAMVALVFAGASGEGVARAQADVAPAAALALARSTARDAMGALVARLPAEAKRRLTGMYVAFDDSATDVNALAACDDDGDYVVVVSDALLRLAETAAAAQATDEVFGTHKLDEYAAFLASAPSREGVRALPPPAGFFDASQARAPAKLALEGVRLREILGAVVAHELTHLVQGDLVCPNPTATHERGDDLWTREERDHAVAVALKIYAPLRVLAADGDATRCLLDAGMTEQGGLAWLSLVDRIEGAHGAPGSTYLALHHDGGVRAEVVRAAADQWRRLHAAAAPPASSQARTVSPPMSTDR